MKFGKRLSVELVHRYFADRKGSPFRFQPTDDCRKQMKRYALYLRTAGHGFDLMQDISKIQKAGNDERFFLDIAVYSPDPLFTNYSNLDIDYRNGHVYYIGNSVPSAQSARTLQNPERERLTLVDPSKSETIETVSVRLKPKRFVIYINAAAGDSYTLKDKLNNTIRDWTVTENGNPPGFYVDVGSLPSGLFTLEKNGQVVEHFYSDDNLTDEKPVFVIGLGPFPVKEKETQNQTLQSRNFQVRINGRSVYWHYYIYSKLNGRRLINLKIVNRNLKTLPDVEFNRKHIDENLKRALFFSQSPIPLSEAAYKSIELTEDDGKGLPLIPNLPNASVSSLRFKEGRWFSEIFVYI